MNRLIAKNFWAILFLIIFAFLVTSKEADAASREGGWDFQCSNHGHNDYKNCGGQEQLFANGQTFYAAATSYQFVGHRHGGSLIGASVCIYLGGQSQCDAWSCSGGSCGEEYGGDHPWNYLDGGGMTVWDNSTWGKVYFTAEVKDAEVRNQGSWAAYYDECASNNGQSCSATSSQNACGQTQTNYGTYQCDGSCSVSTPNPPANPSGYGSSCTGATSSPNACGQSNPGGSGTIQCNGSCSGSSGSTPSNPPGYGNSCTGATSSPNACGQTNPGGSGTIQCNGSCSGSNGSTPANPPGYGNSCTSSANACGQTNSGSIQCNGSCSASTPPNSSCPAPTASISANPNPVNYSSSSTISWSSTNSSSCSVPGIGSGLSGSGSTGALTSNQTYTVTCTGFNGSNISNNVTVSVSAPTVDIKANNSDGPITLLWNTSANLSWTSTNASSCNASGDWSGGKALNSSESTGNLIVPKTYNYTLTCSGNGSASNTVQVILSPPIPNNPGSVTVTEPNYCTSGPAITTSWTYSDPSGSTQQSYQVQLDDNPSFNSVDVDSGKINSNSPSWFSGQGLLQFDKDYKARVRVWNSYDVVSGWTESTICNGPGCIGSSGKWNTPDYAYPQVDFTWTANGILNNPSPPLNKPVQFTDTTVFGNQSNRQWDWLFGDGGSSTLQNPSRTYVAEGSYYVTLTATDNANQVCVRTKGPLIIQKPIPRWREVAPR